MYSVSQSPIILTQLYETTAVNVFILCISYWHKKPGFPGLESASRIPTVTNNRTCSFLPVILSLLSSFANDNSRIPVSLKLSRIFNMDVLSCYSIIANDTKITSRFRKSQLTLDIQKIRFLFIFLSIIKPNEQVHAYCYFHVSWKTTIVDQGFSLPIAH